jgi:hypothetical protein
MKTSALGLFALLSACAATPPPAACIQGSGSPMLVYELFFGRAVRGQDDVSDRQWGDFVDRVVTPNLPDGFTIYDAEGGWMNPTSHRTIRERSKVLMAALPAGEASLAAIGRVRAAYQTEFHQQLVGMTVQPACAEF